MRILNINDQYGEPVDFESVEEMLEAVQESFPEVENLVEGINYEELEEFKSL